MWSVAVIVVLALFDDDGDDVERKKATERTSSLKLSPLDSNSISVPNDQASSNMWKAVVGSCARHVN